jgi:hypothetical protein
MEARYETLGACQEILKPHPDASWMPVLTHLWEAGRLEWSAEAAALRPEFEMLFTSEERAVAKARLDVSPAMKWADRRACWRRRLTIAAALIVALLGATVSHAFTTRDRCRYQTEHYTNDVLQSTRYVDEKLCIYQCPGYRLGVWLKRHQVCPLSAVRRED